MGCFMFEFFVVLNLRSALFTVACSDRVDSRAVFLPLDSEHHADLLGVGVTWE